MQKKTRSLLEELDSMYVERDRRLIIENRANNVIESAIRLLEQIESEYTADQAENLTKNCSMPYVSKIPQSLLDL